MACPGHQPSHLPVPPGAGIDGPLFVGIDTHALSTPAGASALEVFAANGVETMISADDEYTPTPAVSHAIICFDIGSLASQPPAQSPVVSGE